ncbi:sugar phosphate isomerase/epimerase [Nocardioides lentus]|uniref:Sugar phosphate isomerase/epimerase n=1 Tax=Nocardioides lentus TaxID=338077 RepID=A0ABP5AY18_9ACTN
MSGARSVVGLSTSSVYPEPTEQAFAYAAELGYDAVEVMVGMDDTSQDLAAVQRLAYAHQLPICSVHAPCLLFTQRVWGTEPWGKLVRSAEMAAEVGADVVVVHPAFRWQREYARDFVDGIAALEESTGIAFAVENMYPWRASNRRVVRREVEMYLPGFDPSTEPYANTTLDVSHASTAGSDLLAMAAAMGDRLRHLHLTDGSGSPKDEHLVPGRGSMPVAGLLATLADREFAGHVVLEINTRRAPDREARLADLAESLAFARTHLRQDPAAG